MSAKLAFTTLFILTLFVIVTSLLSNSKGKGLTAEEEAQHHQQLVGSSRKNDGESSTTPSSPPLPEIYNGYTNKNDIPSPPKKINSDDSFDTSSTTNEASVILPAVPFSNRQARFATFKKVQRQLSSPQIEALIKQHEDYCTTKISPDLKTRIDTFKSKLKKTLEKASSSPQYYKAVKGNIPVSNIKAQDLFTFEVLNFGTNGEQISHAGHQRIFAFVKWKQTGERVCVDGAVIEASMMGYEEKADIKIERDYLDVDFFIDSTSSSFRTGLYEIQPFIRRAGKYKLCLSLNAIHPDYKWKIDFPNDDDGTSSSSSSSWWSAPSSDSDVVQHFDYFGTSNARIPDVVGNPDCCVRQSYSSRQCFVAVASSSKNPKFKESVKLLQAKLNERRAKNNDCSQMNNKQLLVGSGNGYWTKLSSSSSSSSSCWIDQYGEFVSAEKMKQKQSSFVFYRVCHGDPRNAYPQEFANNKSSLSSAADSDGDEFDRYSYSEKWVFISDVCQIRFFSREEQWNIVNKNWMLWWGASTIKQPVTNFIEYNLGASVFKVPMEKIETIRKVRKRPGFFSYRQFDIFSSSSSSSSRSSSTFRSTMCWGGCPNVAGIPNCGDYTGIANRREKDREQSCVGRALTQQPSSSASSSSTEKQLYPSVLILSHSIWRYPMYNISAFIEQVDDTMKWLEKTICNNSRVQQKQQKEKDDDGSGVTLIWLQGVRRMYEDEESSHCWSDDTRAFNRMLDWKHQEYFENYIRKYNEEKRSSKTRCFAFKNIHFVARHELTSPIHSSGAKFGHFGVHYGATKGMCLTGMSRNEKYSLQRCVRNTAADWMLLQWLMNLMKK